MKISKKLRVFSNRLFVSPRCGGLHWGLKGRGCAGNSGEGEQHRLWDDESNSAGGGGFQPLRTALHTISISLQNSLS